MSGNKISIVTTLYKSAAYVEEFYEKCIQQTESFSDYEIVFVNDGSPDNSYQIAAKIAESNNKVKVVNLSRNFGHHKAIMTGLNYATGDHIFLIDVDLEEDPSILKEYWDRYNSSEDIEHVFGSQIERKGNIFERVNGKIFYKLFNMLSGVKIAPNIITARLMSRRFVNSLLEFKEKEIFIAGLCVLNGYESSELKITKASSSKSSYSLSKRISLLINGITSFSAKPLYLIFYLAITVLIASLVMIGYVVFLKLSYNTIVDGWTSLMIAILLMSGLILFCIGIVAIYISKLFNELKPRPYVIVKNILNE